ncbi:MAG TPA: hypothetical protein VK287_08555 [Gaiellaceae bacterium]|nr:hypothetical protein [Gaiellaceae bacterium]
MRLRARSLHTGAALLAIGAALLVAGCGDSGQPSATEWADGLCSSLTEWTDSVRPVVESLQEETLSKQAVQDATDEVDNATTNLAGELRDLGAPETEAGEQLEASVQRLSSQLDDDVEQIDSAVDNATDPSGVRTAVSEASSALVTMGNRISSTVSELDQIDAKGELEEAFQESDSCQSLSQQGS